MYVIRSLVVLAVLALAALPAVAQSAEVTVSLNEQFFDELLDAAFQTAAPPQFSLAKTEQRERQREFAAASFVGSGECNESVTILRENSNVRTGVRFREGKIIAPIAFTGHYDPPLLGCVPFSGTAEASVVLNFDPNRRILTGNARITNVALDGTGGIGGGLIARMVQSSIDKKINPIQILDLDKLSFVVPIQNSGKLEMKATGIRSEVVGDVLNVYVQFVFTKA